MKYAGSRLVEVAEGEKAGAQYGETAKLKSEVTIYRGGVDRRPVILKAGTRVWRWKTGLGLEPKSAKNKPEK
jgi:hypothetical protein